MQASSLDLMTNLTQWEHIDGVIWLAKHKMVEMLSQTYTFCPFQVTQVLSNILTAHEFEGKYASVRQSLVNEGSLLFEVLKSLNGTPEIAMEALSTLGNFCSEIGRTDWALYLVENCSFFEYLKIGILSDNRQPELIIRAIDFSKYLIGRNRGSEENDSISFSLEKSGCLDAIEIFQGHENM
jgi:hypothetical protein